MPYKLLKIRVDRLAVSTILTIITHSLLPLMLFPFAFFVVPPFEEKSSQLFIEPYGLTVLIFDLSSFIRDNWYVCLLILSFALAIDAVIYALLFRSQKKTAASLWSALVILVQVAFAGLLVIVLLLFLRTLATSPLICPI